jgi:Xaa-Pro aminopeptidase
MMQSQNCSRLKKFQQSLAADGCIVDDPVDLFYLTGIDVSLGRLVVKKRDARFFVDGRYLEKCQKGKCVKAELHTKEAVQKFTARLKTVGFDSEAATVASYEKLKNCFDGKLRPLVRPLKLLRAVKDKTEIASMKKSAQVLWKGFEHVKKQIKTGITELELAKEFEIFCLKAGASGLSFEPIIGFGANTAMPHYRSGGRKLKKGDLILIDIGVMVDSYASDMTRVVHFGKIDPRLVRLERVVKAAHAAALKLCKPGTRIGKLDEAARKVMREAKMEHLFVHSLGHGIGLETHEFPRIKHDSEDKNCILEEGMVFTIEPGLYLPGIGGVRHEDTIVITAAGYQNLYV